MNGVKHTSGDDVAHQAGIGFNARGSLLTWDACEIFRHVFKHLFRWLVAFFGHEISGIIFSQQPELAFLLFFRLSGHALLETLMGWNLQHKFALFLLAAMKAIASGCDKIQTTIVGFRLLGNSKLSKFSMFFAARSSQAVFMSAGEIIESLTNRRLCPIDLLRILGRFAAWVQSFCFFFRNKSTFHK